jgi:maltose/maltodextrin transport system permease protein
VYKLALDQQRFGLAAAYGILMFFFIGGLSLLNMKFSRVFEEVDR